MSAPNDSQDPGIPNWLLFLFFGTFVWGFFYAVFLHGFLDETRADSLRRESMTRVVKATIDIVPARTEVAIANGETTYGQVCVACHGGNLEGGVGPNLADGEWWHGDNEKTMYKLVVNGITAAQAKGPTKVAMPAKGGSNISNPQVWEVIYYLSSKNGTIVQDAEPTQ